MITFIVVWIIQHNTAVRNNTVLIDESTSEVHILARIRATLAKDYYGGGSGDDIVLLSVCKL